MSRLETRGAASCQYALFLLRWLGRAPEDFVTGSTVAIGKTKLPKAGPDRRLRWDLNELHAALDAARRDRNLTWAALGEELGYSASRLTNLRTAKLADMALVMRVTQWLERPAANFIHAAAW